MVNSLRVVLDTNIFISAYFWEGNESDVLRKCKDGYFRLIVSPEIFDELERVLELKFDVPITNIEEYINGLLLFSEIVFPEGKVDMVKEDPSDNIILETALIGKANILITGDGHLLRLKQFENIQMKKAGDI